MHMTNSHGLAIRTNPRAGLGAKCHADCQEHMGLSPEICDQWCSKSVSSCVDNCKFIWSEESPTSLAQRGACMQDCIRPG
jgi:hypothetical protein